MYLSRLYVRDFRSIAELDLRFSKGKTAIVGPNNGGKSNIIKAIDLVLGEANPTYGRSENVSSNDFRAWKEVYLSDGSEHEERATEFFIWCELKRDDSEQLNYEEMYKCSGFYVYSRIREWVNRRPVKEPIRVAWASLPQSYESIFQVTEDDNGDKEYINPKLRNQHTYEGQFGNKYVFAFAFRALCSDDGRIDKDIRFLYREDEQTDWVMSFRAPIRNELLQSAIIPSFRDPRNQLHISTWSWYGKLLKHLTKGCESNQALQTALSDVRAAADAIFDTVNSDLLSSSLQVAFPGTTVSLQFNPDTQDELYKSCLVYVDDGFKSALTDKGAGIQSTLVIGLFNYYMVNVNTVSSALLCVEEPEIYLHPHARRVLSDRLDEFLGDGRNQVILTTHSVEFLRTTRGETDIVLVRREGDVTSARTVPLQRLPSLLADHRAIEFFFASKVIVCEGYDAELLAIIAQHLKPGKLDEANISIVAAGGKDRIRTLTQLIVQLGLKCFVFADFDFFLRDQDDRAAQYSAKPHESVQSLGTKFFSQPCTFGTDSAAYGKIQHIRAMVKRDDESGFYLAKELAHLRDFTEVADLLPTLRRNGLCILPGEIESLCKDPGLMSPNDQGGRKLSLSILGDVRDRLAAGQTIQDLFHLTEIDEFLTAVIAR